MGIELYKLPRKKYIREMLRLRGIKEQLLNDRKYSDFNQQQIHQLKNNSIKLAKQCQTNFHNNEEKGFKLSLASEDIIELKRSGLIQKTYLLPSTDLFYVKFLLLRENINMEILKMGISISLCFSKISLAKSILKYKERITKELMNHTLLLEEEEMDFHLLHDTKYKSINIKYKLEHRGNMVDFTVIKIDGLKPEELPLNITSHKHGFLLTIDETKGETRVRLEMNQLILNPNDIGKALEFQFKHHILASDYYEKLSNLLHEFNAS